MVSPLPDPDITQGGFLSLIDRIIPFIGDRTFYLGASIPCSTRIGDPDERINAAARLVVQLEGSQFYSISNRGERIDVELKPYECIYWAPNAWWLEFRRTKGHTFGIAMMSHCLRLIQILYTGGPMQTGTPWAYHTTLPLTGTGLMVARTLNSLAEEGDRSGAAPELFVALLKLARQHLAEDTADSHGHGRAQTTWRAARTYLEENFTPAISRESVAAALGLHPNYLSALSRQMAAQSFREILDGVRMEHARRLLRQPDLKLIRVAKLCGYTNVVNFIRAFRRATGTTPGRFRATLPISR